MDLNLWECSGIFLLSTKDQVRSLEDVVSKF